MKKFSVKTVVAIGIGAALFFVCGRFIAIPSPVPNTSITIQYGVLAFIATLFGPICGCLMAFIGHALGDAVSYGSVWWSWVIASGVTGFLYGFAFKKVKVNDGLFSKKDIITFNVIQVIANAIGWIVIAPTLDVVMYGEPANLVYTQGIVACVSNCVSAGVIGSLLLFIYAKTRSRKGSLKKED